MVQTRNRAINFLKTIDEITRIEATTEKPKGSCRARYVCFVTSPAFHR
jgi:hypothetical protein